MVIILRVSTESNIFPPFTVMKRYAGQNRILVAVDCIIFGFDGQELKLLLIRRGLNRKKETGA